MGAQFLGLDVGTQGTKAVLVDVDAGRVIAQGAAAYGLIEGLPDGHAEQDPATWLGAVEEATGKLGDLSGVAGIGVSGQQHGAVLLDADRRPLRPAKLWCDTSTAAEASALSAELGRSIPAGFTAPKLRWSSLHEPDLWARTRSVVLPHDYINLELTGDLFTELGDASGTGYVDPVRGDYDARAMATVAPDLESLVPPIVPAGKPAGVLTKAWATRLGLQAGTPVSAGGGDNMMSAIGAGATRPGVVVASLGTSGTIFAYSERAVVDPEGDIAAFRASSSAAGPGGDVGHLPLLCVMNCTEPLAEIRALTGLEHGPLTEAAARVEAGCDGMLFVPFLRGERVPNLPHATGSLRGITPGSMTPGTLYRAALEGVGLNLAHGLGRMRGLGLDVGEVRLVGGAARNPLWQSILAGLFGVPVRALREPETAAIGAALQAAGAVRGAPVDALAQGFVGFDGAAVAPTTDAAELAAYAELRTRFQEAVGELGG